MAKKSFFKHFLLVVFLFFLFELKLSDSVRTYNLRKFYLKSLEQSSNELLNEPSNKPSDESSNETPSELSNEPSNETPDEPLIETPIEPLTELFDKTEKETSNESVIDSSSSTVEQKVKPEKPSNWMSQAPPNISTRKCALLNNSYLSDIALKAVNESIIPSHKLILMYSTPWFDSIINDERQPFNELLLDTETDYNTLILILK